MGDPLRGPGNVPGLAQVEPDQALLCVDEDLVLRAEPAAQAAETTIATVFFRSHHESLISLSETAGERIGIGVNKRCGGGHRSPLSQGQKPARSVQLTRKRSSNQWQ